MPAGGMLPIENRCIFNHFLPLRRRPSHFPLLSGPCLPFSLASHTLLLTSHFFPGLAIRKIILLHCPYGQPHHRSHTESLHNPRLHPSPKMVAAAAGSQTSRQAIGWCD